MVRGYIQFYEEKTTRDDDAMGERRDDKGEEGEHILEAGSECKKIM